VEFYNGKINTETLLEVTKEVGLEVKGKGKVVPVLN
jgi:hypothetical protein